MIIYFVREEKKGNVGFIHKNSLREMSVLTTTAFDDSVHFNVKHPLQNKWTLWFDNPGKKSNQSNWSANLKSVITLDNVEDFWGVYNNIQKASQLNLGSNFHLFKEGIRPEWEDPVNQKGGKWYFFSFSLYTRVMMSPKAKHGELDEHWLNMVVFLKTL